MELIVYSPQEGEFLQKIDWNFEELKGEIVRKTQDYLNLVYTDDQIKEAKNDRANLNKLIHALEAKRKEIKKTVMIPYNGFEKQEKELKDIIEKAVKSIDDQVKEYEKRKKEEKLKKVKEIYAECIGDLDRIITFEKAFKESYLNAGTTLKSIRSEMSELHDRVDKELKLINADISPYVVSMKRVYTETLDFSKAMAKKQELEEADKIRIQAEEARKKQEEAKAEKVARELKEIASQAADPETKIPEPAKPDPQLQEPVRKQKRITFRITADESQFAYLNHALQDLKKNCLQFEIIGKEEL